LGVWGGVSRHARLHSAPRPIELRGGRVGARGLRCKAERSVPIPNASTPPSLPSAGYPAFLTASLAGSARACVLISCAFGGWGYRLWLGYRLSLWGYRLRLRWDWGYRLWLGYRLSLWGYRLRLRWDWGYRLWLGYRLSLWGYRLRLRWDWGYRLWLGYRLSLWGYRLRLRWDWGYRLWLGYRLSLWGYRLG